MFVVFAGNFVILRAVTLRDKVRWLDSRLHGNDGRGGGSDGIVRFR
jgi:hypothetical protein